MDKKQIRGLNSALNEAHLLGVEYGPEHNVTLTLAPVMLDENGNMPEDGRILIILTNVSRVMASLRNGHWDDKKAEVDKFELEQLLEKVRSFEGKEIYGLDFIDGKEESFKWWSKNPSLDFKKNNIAESRHTMDLFQGETNRHLDIKIWFDDLKIFNAKLKPMSIEELVEAGRRGWNRPEKFGIIPLKK